MGKQEVANFYVDGLLTSGHAGRYAFNDREHGPRWFQVPPPSLTSHLYASFSRFTVMPPPPHLTCLPDYFQARTKKSHGCCACEIEVDK